MPRVKFHWSFWLFAIVLVISEKYSMFICALCAVIMHEYAHAHVAKSQGYVLKNLTLMPYGAVLYGAEKIAKYDALIVAVSGPLFNVFLAILTVACWWLFPECYAYTLNFFRANIAIATFNLLPCYPLDGARMILAISKHPSRTLRVLRIMGIVLSCAFLALYVISLFYSVNYTLGVISVMLLSSSINGTEKERYLHIAECVPFLKDTTHPIEKATLYVSKNLALMRLLKHIKSNKIVSFVVLDDELKELAKISEKALSELCLRYPLTSTIESVISNTSTKFLLQETYRQ